MACSSGVAARPSLSIARSVTMAATFALTRLAGPDGARSSWLAGRNPAGVVGASSSPAMSSRGGTSQSETCA
jgi:hypothetical protein